MNRSDISFLANEPTTEEASCGAITKKVLILLMPFATPEFPGLGATLIRSILVDAQIPTDIVYGNLVFSKLIDADPFVENTLSELPICEIAFTPYYFGTPVAEAAASLRNYVLELSSVKTSHPLERYMRIVENAGRCIDSLFESIPWVDYDVVGFSLLMGQTVASLALAKRIKAAHPGITVIVGGAHTQAPMGDEMLRSFREIDYVLQGEADGTVAPFIRELRAGARTSFSTGGILYRDARGEVRSSGDATPFTDLDSLPVPDFSDFFAQMDGLGLTHIQPYLPLETSRGCWWGEKHHCTFCGIDDKIMVFRSKSAARVLREIVTLSSRHQYTEFFAVDSIINFKFFNELLPTLGELRRKRAWDFTFFFESKSNISRDQVRRFRYGGVNHVQPGLESFSDHVLQLMDKGTTGIRQIQCLKLLAEYNIVADWNLIYRSPGETVDDYRECCDFVQFLHHLPPLHAGGLIPMQINRYAPYHDEPERYGVRNIRPKRYYPLIYPDTSIDLDRLAFYFDCDFAEPLGHIQPLYDELKAKIDAWRKCYVPDALIQSRGPGFVQVVDRRSWVPGAPVAPGEERTYVLEGLAAEIFTHCGEMTSLSALTEAFRDRCDPSELAALVDRLVELRLIYRSPSAQLLSLPLLKEAEERFRFAPEAESGPSAVEDSTRLAAPEPVAIRVAKGGRKALSARRALSASVEGTPMIPCGIRLSKGPAGREPTTVQVEGRRAGDLIDEITRTAERTRSLCFRLDGLETDQGVGGTALEALARARAERLVGFQFECELKRAPTAELAERMREAGISKVLVSRAMGASRSCTVASNLERIAAVKSLSAAGISVQWELDPRADTLGDEGRARLLAICHAARHLPPPHVTARSNGALLEAVHRWTASHRPRTLTYARGPGFVRVFDRRAEDGTWRFVSMREAQAHILAACEQPTSVAALLEATPGQGEAQVRSFLDTLVAHGIMCAGLMDEYLALPIRRSIEERWASGDN